MTPDATQQGAEAGPVDGREVSPRHARTSDESTAELLRDLSRELATLVRQEVQLATDEVSGKLSRTIRGAGVLAAAVVIALLGFGGLVTAGIVGLHHVWALWLSALVIGAALVIIAGIAALVGTVQIRRGAPPVPAEAAESTKEDVEWLKTHVSTEKR